MKKVNESLILSSNDLVGNLNCKYLTQMDIDVAKGIIEKPKMWDPLLEILRERGLRHEQAYLDHLTSEGMSSREIEGVDITQNSFQQTLQAMKDGVDVIIQAALKSGNWAGRADVLLKVDKPSHLGDWSYEIIDTKLARETKGSTVLQLCLYADLLSQMQGRQPEYVYVVTPWSDFKKQTYRVDDFGAFFRKAKLETEQAVTMPCDQKLYPDPRTHCDICRWLDHCNTKRRYDDHLSLVANISKGQINEFNSNGIDTLKALSLLPPELPWKPERGSKEGLERVSAQARIQVKAREAGELLYERLSVVPGTGLTLLPEPSDGDIFFDIEGDPFVGEEGLEYLFGYHYYDTDGKFIRVEDWAFTRANEKHIFETFINFVTQRLKEYPNLHIYHYASYEESALKRLMGRYATKQTEVDDLLRGNILVDLFKVVRNGIRASVESYSIKKLEPFYKFIRTTELRDANISLTALSAALELNHIEAITDEIKNIVASYNNDDCLSTEHLRNWLEDIRIDAINNGEVILRPEPISVEASEEISLHEKNVNELIKLLTYDVPIDPEERNSEQQARWILANTLDWHRREEKAIWWEYFRLKELSTTELLDEKAGLGDLVFLKTVDQTKSGIPTDRYKFSQQDTDIKVGDKLRDTEGQAFGEVIALSQDDRTIEVKKSRKTAHLHPSGVFSHTHIPTKEQVQSLMRLGKFVADYGISGIDKFQSSRDLLLCHEPRLSGQNLHAKDINTLDNARRIVPYLNGGVLPVQGPPGTGKTFTGGHMIYDFISAGKSVGITANSHKVIRNLLDKSIEISVAEKNPISAGQKLSSKNDNTEHVEIFTDNSDAITAIEEGSIQLLGGTSFFWSREDAMNLVDVLFVDEAAQMSLANVLAVSPAAPQIVLLGDPQQLDQPMQGTHPDGTGVSALDHILAGKQTIGLNQGLFLEKTWRLHPDITCFNSELFYNSELTSEKTCSKQGTLSDGLFGGTGLRYVPINHTGNQSSSTEEAMAVKQIVDNILSSNTHWTNRHNENSELTLDDIIIIAPYNAQVFEIQQLLPDANIGTVDKFQGQEAVIAIYSMATSSYADAPRGMDFLYSSNRLNVAISRAKCMAILVSSPEIFEVDCKKPKQMQLANAFCRYLEMAETIHL